LIKLGYSQDQLDKIGKSFLERYGGKTIENASTTFKDMVRSSGSAHSIKNIKSREEIEREIKREKDLENKTSGSVKATDNKTDQEAIDWMIKRQKEDEQNKNI